MSIDPKTVLPEGLIRVKTNPRPPLDDEGNPMNELYATDAFMAGLQKKENKLLAGVVLGIATTLFLFGLVHVFILPLMKVLL